MRIFLVVLFSLFITACKTVTIEAPKNNQVVINPPDISISFPSGVPDKLQVTLNNSDVTQFLTITSTGASLKANVVQNYLQESENFIRVVNPTGTLPVRFYFDNSGPIIHILSVTESGTSVVISGYVSDDSGVKVATIDGNKLTLDSNKNFSYTTTKKEMYDLYTVDTNGFIRSEKYVRNTTPTKNSVSVKIDKSGLKFLVGETNKVLASKALGPLLVSLNPLKSGKFILDSYQINVKDASLQKSDMNIVGSDTEANTFYVSGTFYGVWAKANFVYDFWLPGLPSLNVDGNVMVDSVDFTAKAVVNISNGSLQVSIPSISTKTHNIRTDIANFPDGLIDIFLNTFDGLVNFILSQQLKGILPDKLAQFVDTFPKSIFIDINGNQLKPDIVPESFKSSSSAIDIKLTSRVYNLTNNGIKTIGGFWASVPAVPDAVNISPSKKTLDIGAAVSQDMVNQIMSSAAQAGLITTTIKGIDLTGATTATIKATAQSSPFIEFVKSDKGLAKFTMRDFYIGIDGLINGSMTKLISATVDIEAFVNISVDDKGFLGLEFVGTPKIRIRKLENGTLTLPQDLVQGIIDDSTLTILPMIQPLLAKVPLPSVMGYSINLGDLWVATPGIVNVNLSIVDKNLVTSTVPVTMATVSGVYDKSKPIDIPVSGNYDNMTFKYKLDIFPYTGWKSRTSITFNRLLPGPHVITICGRTSDLVEDKVCTTSTFIVK